MSRRIIYALAGVGLVIVVAAYWFLVLDPIRSDISKLDEEVAAEQQTLVVAQTKLAQMEQTRVEARKNQARLIELAKMIPQTEEIPSLLLQIQDLATEAGIEFTTITPGTATEAGEFQIVPVNLEFEGTFFDVNDFLYRAEQMAATPGRLLAPKELSLEPLDTESTAASPDLKVTITMLAFERNPDVAAASTSKATVK